MGFLVVLQRGQRRNLVTDQQLDRLLSILGTLAKGIIFGKGLLSRLERRERSVSQLVC